MFYPKPTGSNRLNTTSNLPILWSFTSSEQGTRAWFADGNGKPDWFGVESGVFANASDVKNLALHRRELAQRRQD